MRALSVLLIAVFLSVSPISAEAVPKRGTKTKATKKISFKQKAHKVRVRFDAWLVRMKTRLKEAEHRLLAATIGSTKIHGDYVVLAITNKAMTKPPLIVTVRGGKSTRKDVVVERVGSPHRGVGTYYRVVKPANAVVIKGKFNVYCRTGKDRLKTSCPAIYVPATVDFRRPELTYDGLAYLEKMARDAAAELRKLGVRSYAHPDKLVADVFSPEDIEALAVVEHIDPGEFLRTKPRDRTLLIESVLASIGANRGNAYKYACSPAGACGLPQFMPKSYQAIIAMYPGAWLYPWFMTGMADHLNGMKAMYLHFDWTLNALRKHVGDDKKFHALLAARRNQCGPFHAATYNAGPRNVIGVFLKKPKTWHLPGSGLIRQPRVYVEIYRAVKDDLRRRRAKKRAVAGESTETGDAIASRK